MGTLPPQVSCPRCGGPLYDIWGPEPTTEGPHCLLLDDSHYECKLCDCKTTDVDSCHAYPRVIPAADATRRQRADAKRSCAERRRSIGASSRTPDVNSQQEMNWLVDAARIAKLVAGGSADLAPIFWIRLYGILHEIHARMANLVAVTRGHGGQVESLFDAFLAEIVTLVPSPRRARRPPRSGGTPGAYVGAARSSRSATAPEARVHRLWHPYSATRRKPGMGTEHLR